MGSVGFDGEVECQSSTTNYKKYKLPRTLLVGCGSAVNHVPRKLRSAIKKRARESIESPLSISKKQRHVSNRAETLKKDKAEKSKPKRGHITKDEEEVAETLYALATIFSDTNKAHQTELNDEPTDTKSSAVLEEGSSMNAVEDIGIPTQREESRKISSKVTLDATWHSPNLLDSKAQVVKLQSSDGAKKSELSSTKQTSSSTGVESYLRLFPTPRVSSEHVIDLEQAASGAQYGEKYYPMNDKYNGLFQSPTGAAQSSDTHGSCLRLPAWLESTNFTSQPPVIENNITTKKCTRVEVQSKESWKRKSSTHVYISRLIKVLQISERKEGLPEKPTQLTTCGGAHQMTGINGRKRGVSFNGIVDYAADKDSAGIQNDNSLRKRLIQDHQLATESPALCSAKEGYDLLCLGTEVCGLGVNRAGRGHESPKQFHASSYLQSRNHSSVLFSLPQNNGCYNGSFTARMGRQVEMQQQKWAPHLPPDCENGKRDPAQALFPHLHSGKYQQLSPPPQAQQLMSIINSSLPLPSVEIHNQQHHHHHHYFPLGFQRNNGGAATFYSDNII